MLQNYPRAGRRLVMADERTGAYVWACSNCRWNIPFVSADKKPTGAAVAIKDFKLHSCRDHPFRKASPSDLAQPPGMCPNARLGSDGSHVALLAPTTYLVED
jgi:hypothetical protein